MTVIHCHRWPVSLSLSPVLPADQNTGAVELRSADRPRPPLGQKAADDCVGDGKKKSDQK